MVLKQLLRSCATLAVGIALPSVGATLDEVLEQAYQSNLDYLVSFEQVMKAREAEHIAYAKLYPSLALTGARREQLDNNQGQVNDSGYSARLQLSQTLYNPAVWHDWKKAELQLLDAELSYLRQKQQLTFLLKQAWFQLLTDIALAEEATQSLARLKQHRTNAGHLYENGKIWRNDLLQADVRVARGEQTLLVAENTVQRTRTNLNVLLNQNILTEIAPEADVVDLTWDMPLADSLVIAIKQRPDLKQRQIAIDIAKRNKSSAFSTYFPTVTAQVQENRAADDIGFSDSAKDTQLNINFSWTLWDTLSNRSRNRSAHHDVQIALKNHMRVKELVQQETHLAWLALQEARQNYQVLEKSLQQAEENFRVTGIRYKEQLSTANDVLDAQDLLTSTRNDLLEAKGAFQIARAQLELAIGK